MTATPAPGRLLTAARRGPHARLRPARDARRRADARHRRRSPGSATSWSSATPSTCILAPGPERIAALGGLHRFMGWERAIITDSGGFQVFSLAHGSVADEIKGRRGARRGLGAVLEHRRGGVAFRSYIDGSERFLGPEESMEVQAALGSDIALAFDECTPFHADRDYTARARPSAPTAGSSAASRGTASTARRTRPCSGSSRAASTRTCAASRPRRWPTAGGRRDRDRRHPGPRQAGDARGARR